MFKNKQLFLLLSTLVSCLQYAEQYRFLKPQSEPVLKEAELTRKTNEAIKDYIGTENSAMSQLLETALPQQLQTTSGKLGHALVKAFKTELALRTPEDQKELEKKESRLTAYCSKLFNEQIEAQREYLEKVINKDTPLSAKEIEENARQFLKQYDETTVKNVLQRNTENFINNIPEDALHKFMHSIASATITLILESENQR